jgi:hypothetical protein
MRKHGLSIALFGLFFLFQIGLSIVGQRQHNREQDNHGQPPLSYFEYLTSAGFLEATMENWESEFLQMFAYVLLTVSLFQKGSSESKKLDAQEAVDRDPRLSRNKRDAPWPVRKGGVILTLYENSLSLALFFLFVLSFLLHALGGRVNTASKSSHTVGPRFRSCSILVRLNSGSNPYRTGRASFFPSACWWC